jgi:hypothetical protein
LLLLRAQARAARARAARERRFAARAAAALLATAAAAGRSGAAAGAGSGGAERKLANLAFAPAHGHPSGGRGLVAVSGGAKSDAGGSLKGFTCVAVSKKINKSLEN